MAGHDACVSNSTCIGVTIFNGSHDDVFQAVIYYMDSSTWKMAPNAQLYLDSKRTCKIN